MMWAAVAGGSVPPLFANVTLLSGFEGTDGQTTFTDESEDARTITTNGNAQVDTAQFKFGSSSLLLPPAGGDYLTVPDSNDWEFNQVMTVEAFVRLNELDRLQTIVGKRNTGTQEGWQFYVGAANKLTTIAFNAGATSIALIGTTNFVTDQWFHVALVREADGRYTNYIDGVLETTAIENVTAGSNTNPLHIGRDITTAPARDWNGWIDEIRITTGEAVYTAPFTPPTQAHPRS